MNDQNFSYTPRKRRESKYEAETVRALQAAGWRVYKTPLGDGFPDRMCLRTGTTIFIEFKAKGGRLSPAQKLHAERLRAEGFKVFELRDGDEIPEDLIFKFDKPPYHPRYTPSIVEPEQLDKFGRVLSFGGEKWELAVVKAPYCARCAFFEIEENTGVWVCHPPRFRNMERPCDIFMDRIFRKVE